MDSEINNLAKELYQQKSVLIMGRGYHYATCLEGALVSRHLYSNAGDEGSKNILEKIFNFLTTQGEKKTLGLGSESRSSFLSVWFFRGGQTLSNP